MVNKKSDQKGFGIAALILGICAFIGSWIPIVNWFAVPLWILALVFGIIAVVKTNAKGMGITGIILGGVSILIFIIMNFVITAAVIDVVNNDQQVRDEIEQVLDNYDYEYTY